LDIKSFISPTISEEYETYGKITGVAARLAVWLDLFPHFRHRCSSNERQPVEQAVSDESFGSGETIGFPR
jgi:hypothetical protein